MNRFVFVLSVLAAAVKGADNSCAIDCNGNGSCKKGNANFANHPKDASGEEFDFHKDTQTVLGEYCECNSGFTGIYCNHTFERCNQGEHTCFHGGKCVPALNIKTSKEEFVCDCRKASDLKTGIHYVGKYCEHPSVGRCNDEKEFCVNGGTCQTGQDAEQTPCKCTNEFEGRHCEFKKNVLPSCNLRCLNQGKCVKGFRHATTAEKALNSSFEPNHNTFQHCSCKPGYFGIFCERQTTQCGDRHCFNGASCISRTNPSGVLQYHCNCTDSKNSTHSFAGRGCEARSTSFCTRGATPNGHTFCTNGGGCKDMGNGIFGCTCPSGFEGPHCEFPKGRPLLPGEQQCNLQCKNNGKCRQGIKDLGLLSNFNDLTHLINQTVDRHAFEHCVCPDGFTGLFCEHKINVCGAGKHVCFHGSHCVQNGEDWRCNCLNTEDPTAGNFCQHKATSVCNQAQRTFCVNGGICKDGESPNQATCTCTDGFHGPHCEFATINKDDSTQSAPVSASSNPTEQNLTILIFLGAISVFGVLSIVCVVAITGKNKTQSNMQREHPTKMPPPSAFPASPMSDSGAPEISKGDASTSTDTTKGEKAIAEENEII